MSGENATDCLLFPELGQRPVVVAFDQVRSSSDGGAVLLRAADQRLGLTAALAGALIDARDQDRVIHLLGELVQQRVFSIACGYADCNDAERLAEDPLFKLLVGRDPVKGQALASQPTLSRFENMPARRDLVRMGEALADTVIARHRKRLGRKARLITIDLDQTEDPTHGAQQLSMFNGYYGNWCYIPLLAFVSFNDEKEQFALAALLRPGNAPDRLGARGLLRRLLAKLRLAFPRARFRVRLDGGFAGEHIFGFLDAQPDLEYTAGMPKNSVLVARAEDAMKQARELSASTDQSARIYAETSYAAKTWSTQRRVIIKAEVTRLPGREPKDNPRFLVTNLRETPQWAYEEIYCQRGEIENRIKELHHGLEIDRTSCCRFLANQLRVLLTLAAYVLMQELRLRAAGTLFARAQVSTLRDHLLKVGARLTSSVRRIVLHLPSSFAFLRAWTVIARRLGAAHA